MELRELTTLRVGGAAAEFVAPETRQQLIDTARAVWATGDDWLALGGGSNLVVADAGVPGTVWSMAPALFAALVIAWPRIPARRPTA